MSKHWFQWKARKGRRDVNEVGRIDFWGNRHVSVLELSRTKRGQENMERMQRFLKEQFPEEEHNPIRSASIVKKEVTPE